jgi:hypothetical protein
MMDMFKLFKPKQKRVLKIDETPADLMNAEGDYLEASAISDSDQLSQLSQSIDSTVFISGDRFKPNGSGIVVNYDGDKYLITATHVIAKKAFGNPTDLKVFERNEDRVIITDLESLRMVYSSITARQENLPVGDVAVFQYSGELKGVDLAELVPGSYESVAVGYPGNHANIWMENLRPLLSPGQVVIPSKSEKKLTPYMQKLMEKHGLNNTPASVPKIIFTGATSGGNSGGGLFTLDSKLIGVCRGPEGTIGKETGNEEFYSVKEVLEAIAK